MLSYAITFNKIDLNECIMLKMFKFTEIDANNCNCNFFFYYKGRS